MSRNMLLGTQASSMKYWEADKAFREQVKIIKKKGRPKGSKSVNVQSTDDPRTPFEALRVLLNIGRVEWGERLDISQGTVGSFERGDCIPNVSLAKRIQEEARKQGIAVTLDELYQHVIPHGYEDRVQE